MAKKREVWIRSNLRAGVLSFVVPGVLAGIALVILGVTPARGWWWLLHVTAWLLLLIAACIVVTLTRLLRPRLTYGDGRIWAQLDLAAPIGIPVDLVEVFFFGHSASMLPPRLKDMSETSTVVIRLAESAKEWHNRDVNSKLGQWCQGYVILRGTWTEPITPQLLTSLNDRLVAIHRELKSRKPKEQSP